MKYKNIGYICMPESDFNDNRTVQYAMKAIKMAHEDIKNIIPISPYLLFLEDNFEDMCMKLIELSAVVFVFDGAYPTKKMQKEIEYARHLKKPICNYHINEIVEHGCIIKNERFGDE